MEPFDQDVVVEDFDADVTVESSSNQTGNQRKCIADCLPAIGGDSLERRIVGIPSLVASAYFCPHFCLQDVTHWPWNYVAQNVSSCLSKAMHMSVYLHNRRSSRKQHRQCK